MNKLSVMRLLAFGAAIILTLSACSNRYEHLDLPNNVLRFSAEGGSQKYTYERILLYERTYINNSPAECEPLYKDNIYRGVVVEGWLSIFDRDDSQKFNNYQIIEVQPNTTGKERSAEIRYSIPGSTDYDCELYVIQAEQ